MQYGAVSKSMYRIAFAEILCAYIQVRDFVIVSKSNGSDVVGHLIDVSTLDDINVDKVSLDSNSDYFSLTMAWAMTKCVVSPDLGARGIL